jgi:hypothetical protein
MCGALGASNGAFPYLLSLSRDLIKAKSVMTVWHLNGLIFSLLAGHVEMMRFCGTESEPYGACYRSIIIIIYSARATESCEYL